MSSSELSRADKDAVRAQIASYVRTALAGDAEGWGMTLAEDVVVMPPNMAALRGRAAAVDWLKTFPKLTKFAVDVSEIKGNGDVAYTHGTYDFAATLPDGESVADRGSFVNVFRRVSDGSWPYTVLMWHSDPPASPGKRES